MIPQPIPEVEVKLLSCTFGQPGTEIPLPHSEDGRIGELPPGAYEIMAQTTDEKVYFFTIQEIFEQLDQKESKRRGCSTKWVESKAAVSKNFARHGGWKARRRVQLRYDYDGNAYEFNSTNALFVVRDLGPTLVVYQITLVAQDSIAYLRQGTIGARTRKIGGFSGVEAAINELLNRPKVTLRSNTQQPPSSCNRTLVGAK